MIVIGLTGSIGMGKSTVAAQFEQHGVRVCSADAIVHNLMRRGGYAVEEIAKHFPTVIKNDAVDRKKLGEIVFKHPDKRKILEDILHPLVVAEEEWFVRCEARKGAKMVVLEIPLLFETGAQNRCDITVVATAPHYLQTQRVMRRPNMTREKFHAILKAQMPDREKRQRAGVVIQTGLGKRHSALQVAHLIKRLHTQEPQ